MGELKDKAKGLGNEAAGNLKQATAGDDAEQRAEGRAQENKGEAQQLKGKVKGAMGDSI
ncbi:CsbD family protein [Novosphingobium sp. M1R2S20]|uniref:CsbD family protein n=1 Tax=Novosphingobium rhizovicinum TaxID=3228928 RepID=A0ABV3RFM0_9SPHN